MTQLELNVFVTADSLLDLSKYDSLPLEDRPTRALITKDKDGKDVLIGTPVAGMGSEDSVLLGPSLGKDYYRIGFITDKFGVPNQKAVRTLHISQFAAK